MEGEEAENAKKVAKYIIKNTPVGHLNKSIENLKVIIGDTIMNNPEVIKEINNYGENHFDPVQVEFINSKVVISPQTKDSDGYYYDQTQNVKFKMGPDGMSAIRAEKIEFSDTNRDAIEKALQSYINKYYKNEVAKYNVYYDGVPNKIIIVISAHNLNLKNFWSGEWLSSWELDLNSMKLTGNIRANTYYYEEGNVQFNLNTNWDTEIIEKSGDAMAEEIINFIETSENSLQNDIEKVYDDFSDIYIKPLRRRLPVTGTKMNWNLNQVQLNQNN